MSDTKWKVPFRDVYADGFSSWAKYTFWCHVVLKLYPTAYDGGLILDYLKSRTKAAEADAKRFVDPKAN